MTTLVLGASTNIQRYSNIAIKKLVLNKIEVKAIGLKTGVVENVLIEKDLVKFKNIHTVSLYLNKLRQKEYYDYIISLKPKRVIFNPGTENPDFYRILKSNHISYFEACTLVLLSTNQY
jgi:hypothetical protein|tara:strand:+ start:150 stop:506 length:357 start_codon:yes stop_codon:yes gene_type:complete